MDVLVNLRTFLMVVRCGAFSEAARQLNVVPSVTAKRITQLEKTVGARLFKRSTRSVSLTEAGLQLQGKAADLVAEFDEVVQVLKRKDGQLEGHIRIMAPTTLTLSYLGGLLSGFLREHPRISMEVALMDRSSNPLEEGFDMAISGRSASYEGVVDVPLCSVQPLLCASPEYVERRGEPAHPRELIEHDCLVFKPAGNHWLFQSARGIISVDVAARLTADDNLTLLQATKASCGIAIIPRYVAQEPIDKGHLRILLHEYPPQENWFKAYVPRRKQELARIKALLEYLTQNMAGFAARRSMGEAQTAPRPVSKKRK
jgi:DNA-binding transcriptional LysR family regulator